MTTQKIDVLLVGGGIMSATLGTLLAQLDPTLKIAMVERLEDIAQESSDAWNNAGTGHAGYCELNYTPQTGSDIAINRALAINAAFEVSLQFWSWLVEREVFATPSAFIRATPHSSFVWGGADITFLRRRHALLSKHHLFQDMAYSEDAGQIREWMPLVMQDRSISQPIAATRVAYGTDVDFGTLARGMVDALVRHRQFSLHTNCSVRKISRQGDSGCWQVTLRHGISGKEQRIDAGFVFLGAGGAALPLLQKSGIPEGRGYGGFPVSGQWLVCNNPDVIHQHNAKVYGKAPLGAPPMSVPHLDTRIINGQPTLLFGPFAGFTTKLLKQGSRLDMLATVRRNNLKSMLGAGIRNVDLTRYLVGEVFQSHRQRMDYLRQFYPLARDDEWVLSKAGQRVQVIKQGKLEFGTEVVTAADGSLAALLGASPGASTSVQAMIGVIERCFSDRIRSAEWQAGMKAMVPSYQESLIENSALLGSVRRGTMTTLGLAETNLS